MIPFPSIKQFRDVIRNVHNKAHFVGLDAAGEPVYDNRRPVPALRFRGSVKLHGSNAAVVFGPNGIGFQSRERVLTLEDDNFGFHAHMSGHMDELRRIAVLIAAQAQVSPSPDTQIVLYGEWCGGTIQNKVALTGLPTMFVIFAVWIDGNWYDVDTLDCLISEAARIRSIADFPQYDMVIDFAQPALAQGMLGDITRAVELRCPAGLALGREGVGEGVVWRCLDEPGSDYWFKVKGQKHSASRVTKLAAVSVEKIAKTSDFVAMAVSEARLSQGLHNLIHEQRKPFDMSGMADFIRWVVGDVMKEEADTIAANGFDPRKLGEPIAAVARRWYCAQLADAPRS